MTDEPRCDHRHWMRIGGACPPCFNAHWAKLLPVGTYVTYADEPTPPTADAVGVVVEPTVLELRAAKVASDPLGPDAGHLLVQWGEAEGERYWEDPPDLRMLSEREYRGAMLDVLVRESAELGLYEATAEPRDTR